MAAKMETFGKAYTPSERWDQAVKSLYPTTPAGQKKSAPRAAFLGLCEAGLVKDVRPGPPTSGSRNKVYAVQAAELLAAGTHKTVTQLWSAVTKGEDVQHSAQMDVVLALWKNGMLLPVASQA